MSEPSHHLSEAKERYLLEGQKAYIAINGAGAIALLAFLQAIWDISSAASLRPWILCGILAFAVGVGIGVSSYPLRHRAFVAGATAADHPLYRICYFYVPVGTIVMFLLGLGLPVAGAFCNL